MRVQLPAGLLLLARIEGEILLPLPAPVTLRATLEALEKKYPALRGTIRDAQTGKRRPFIRFFACKEDYSNLAPDDALPDAVAAGDEVFMVVGAIAGG